MKYFLFFVFTTISLFADLNNEIISKAKTACYLKNPNNGLGAENYAPVVIGQTFRMDEESTFSENDGTICQDWELNPYVNIDTETYQVIAQMTCDVAERVEGNGESAVTYYDRVIKQYSLDIDCRSACDFPRDSNGNLYEFTPNISQTECTVAILQQLLDAENPNSNYIIDDAQYLTCESSPSSTGCFYHKHVDFNGTLENNSTDINMTETNEKLDDINKNLNNVGSSIDNNGNILSDINNSLDELNTGLSSKIDVNGIKIDALGTKIDNNGLKIDAVRDSVIDTGNYLGSKFDTMGNSITDELKFQGDRLHDDLNDLKSESNNSNNSNGFDDSGIIEAIHKNTDEINRSIEMDRDKVDELFDNFDLIKDTINNLETMTNDLKTSISDIKSSFTDVYTPNFQHYNSCIYKFTVMNNSIPIDICGKVSFLRPFIVFLLTIYFLVLLVRLHLFFIAKLMIKYG